MKTFFEPPPIHWSQSVVFRLFLIVCVNLWGKHAGKACMGCLLSQPQHWCWFQCERDICNCMFPISNSPTSSYLQPLSVCTNNCVTPCRHVHYCSIKLCTTSLGAGFLFITELSPALGLTELISVEYQDPFCGVNWLEHEPDYSPPSAV